MQRPAVMDRIGEEAFKACFGRGLHTYPLAAIYLVLAVLVWLCVLCASALKAEG